MASPETLVDPTVSRQKFARELEAYRQVEADCRRRGWLLLKAEFPEVLVAFAQVDVVPTPVVVGARLDFTNYDLWAPSVRLVNPFTGEPYRADQLPTRLWYRQPGPSVTAMTPQGPVEQVPIGDYVQAYPGAPPFVCMAGVREYHQHPAHSGDSWLLYRGSGRGSLFFLLDKLWQHGVRPLTLRVQMQVVLALQGERVAEAG